MWLNLGIGLISILGVLVGAELVVNGSQRLARTFGLSEFFIGLTVLSIGTSLPEIFTHIIGSSIILREPETAHLTASVVLGTNIGSNLFQITLITGAVGLFGYLHTNKQFMQRDYLFMLSSICLLWFMCLDGSVSSMEGLVLLFGYLAYIVYLSKSEHVIDKVEHHPHSHWVLSASYVFAGLLLLIYCADQVLHVATYFSDEFGVSGSMIGALVVGVCTALPELTTSLIALFKHSSGLSLGTLVGSNITNPMMAVGAGTVITPYFVDFDVLWFDIPFWFIVSLLGFFMMRPHLHLKKRHAALLIICYLIYLPMRMML